MILIKRFRLAKLLVIDEQFNGVSAHDYSTVGNYIPQVSGMLDILFKNHGYTILAITQEPKLAETAKAIYELIPGKTPSLRKRDYASISEEGAIVEADKAEVA